MKYGFLFLLLAIVLGGAAVRGGPWTWILFYPAFSFVVVASAYVCSAPVLFGKRLDGRRSATGTLLLMPYLVYVAAVWNIIRLLSREPKIRNLNDEIVLSRRLLGHERPSNIASAVDLTCEFTEPSESWSGSSYLCYPMLDGTATTATGIGGLVDEIMTLPRPVLIHCAQGHGRTGLVAAAVLLRMGKAQNASEAIAIVREARPGVRLNSLQRSLLEQLIER